DPGCMKCMDCVSVCPNGALYWGFGKPSVTVKKSLPRNYSLTWPEEILAAAVFAASYFAVWDVYQLVPMLMALGIACVTTFVALRTFKLFRATELSFYRFNLKLAGTIQSAGWIFIAFSVFWIGVNAHSGWIRYNEVSGAKAFSNLEIPDELALAQRNPARWLSVSDQANIADGRRYLNSANDFGFFTNADTLPKLAWLEFLAGNAERAADALGFAAEHQQRQARALSLYYRGAILNRLGRHEEALLSLDSAVAERPDLITAMEEKGVAFWNLRRIDEATAMWRVAVAQNSNPPMANSFLEGAAILSGDAETAAFYKDQASRNTPNDPLFHWMLGLRLKNLGMNELAAENFKHAIELNPEFRRALN
ncbi:MAG: hypothetical protein ACJ72Z_14335, partial [Pyrinomonadaceae bacterium]